jgi:uncharacterized protein involved in exopolysaccharide biosynthesis
MDMELVNLVKIILRWSWLIILIVVATVALLYWNLGSSVLGYRAEVILLISTPDREDVSALDDYTFTSDRDEVTIAINKFVDMAQYSEVRRRTLRELGIEENYGLTVDAELGADFIHLSVTASSPELAAQIANTHAAKAIDYFGEVRALPSNQANDYFEVEVAIAASNVQDAETALNTFKTEHGLASLEEEIALQYNILEQLEISRAQLLVYQATGGLTTGINLPSAQMGTIMVTNEQISDVDALIDAQRLILADLTALEPQYNTLEANVSRARDYYDSITLQQSDTELRNSFSRQAMFLQVIQAADIPSGPEDNTVRTLVLGAVGSLGLSILLAFILDYLFRRW